MPDTCCQLAFLGIGGAEFLFVMLVLLMMFGAKDAPRIFRKINEMLNQMRHTADGFKREIMYGDLNVPSSPRAPDAVEDNDAHYEEYDPVGRFYDEEVTAAHEEAEASDEAFMAMENKPDAQSVDDDGGGDVPKT